MLTDTELTKLLKKRTRRAKGLDEYIAANEDIFLLTGKAEDLGKLAKRYYNRVLLPKHFEPTYDNYYHLVPYCQVQAYNNAYEDLLDYNKLPLKTKLKKLIFKND